jgi:hypothetical protein
MNSKESTFPKHSEALSLHDNQGLRSSRFIPSTFNIETDGIVPLQNAVNTILSKKTNHPLLERKQGSGH